MRAALSSSGSLLLRLSSSVFAIRRSRGVCLLWGALALSDPNLRQLVQVLHNARVFFPTARETSMSDNWPAEKERTGEHVLLNSMTCFLIRAQLGDLWTRETEMTLLTWLVSCLVRLSFAGGEKRESLASEASVN